MLTRVGVGSWNYDTGSETGLGLRLHRGHSESKERRFILSEPRNTSELKGVGESTGYYSDNELVRMTFILRFKGL